MGYIPQPTAEMGEYSIEVRRESFYLMGEDVYDVVFEGAEEPRHIIHFYPNVKPADGEPVSEDDLDMLLHVVSGSLGSLSGVVHTAWKRLEAELARARAAEGHYRERLVNCGTVEILTEDIPKIRACFDLVERVENGEKGL